MAASDVKLFLGDCLQILPTLVDNSIDALVTDPPAGISFMGKEWDADKGGRDTWVAWLSGVMRECLRVLKPGGHALVWALPRTSHWTGWALEEAGFEIRDRVAHLFGSGFPKSCDISKQIDKAAGKEREVIGTRPRFPDGGRGAKPGSLKMYTSTIREFGAEVPITAPATDAARQWQGWGTALKPACEDWWLCRKPLSEPTIAANMLRWGTGALAIDRCRIMPENRRHDDGAYKHLSSLYSDACKNALSLSFARDALRHIVFALRSYNIGDIDHVHSVDGQDGIQTVPAEYAMLVTDLFPNGVWCGLNCYKVQGSLSDYQPYLHFYDEYARVLIKAALISAPSLADALEHICGGQLEQIHTHDYQYTNPYPKLGDDLISLCFTFLLDVWVYCTTYLLSRQDNDERHRASAWSNHTKSKTFHGEPYQDMRGIQVPLGRWPANVTHDGSEEVLAGFPMTTSGARTGPNPNATHALADAFGGGWKQTGGPCEASTGSAARFFYCAPFENTCTLCYNTYTKSNNAELETWKNILVRNAERRGWTTQAISEFIARISAIGNQSISLVHNVRCAGNLCDSCAMSIVVALVGIKTSALSDEELQVTLDSIGNCNNSILIQNLASFAELWVNTDTIPTTTSLTLLFGSVAHAIESYTRKESKGRAEEGNDLVTGTRFRYCAKASKQDRDEGLDELPETLSRRYGEQGQGPLVQQTPRTQVTQHNHHPTVKSTSLMRWLCRLITPPSGIVLDCFMGSGSTGKAAVLEGFSFIGIEWDADYFEIAKRRIAIAQAQLALPIEGMM